MSERAAPITTTDDPRAGRVHALLGTKQQRASRNQILIENEPNIVDAVSAGLDVTEVFVAERAKVSDAFLEHLPDDLPVVEVAAAVMGWLFERTRAPEVFALATTPAARSLRSLESTAGDLVVLDGLDGPGNIGSIIRVSSAFEAAGVVFLGHDRADIYARGVIRAAQGNMFKLPLVPARLVHLQKFCEANETLVAITSAHGGAPLHEVVAETRRVALVLGSETRGVSPEVERMATVRCHIPMNERVESLNVASAASILLFLRSRFGRELVSMSAG